MCIQQKFNLNISDLQSSQLISEIHNPEKNNRYVHICKDLKHKHLKKFCILAFLDLPEFQLSYLP